MSEILEMLRPAVEEQMASAETGYVKDTFDRLVKKPDIEAEEAKMMIAVCLADEMERMAVQKAEFDEERYRAMLEMLPIMPEEG